MTGRLKNIAVFCGSTQGNNEAYIHGAMSLATAMVEQNIGLVYGGGNRGLMGIVSTEVHRQGMPVHGVLPSFFNVPEVRNGECNSTFEVVPGMHERKARMAERADGFIAMPGGIGTFEEFFEVFTWKQIHLHEKPVALFNINGFYDGLLAFLETTRQQGFLSSEALQALIVDDDPHRLLERMSIQQTSLPSKLG